MRTGKRHIKSGDEYNHLFPSAQGEYITVQKNASTLDHTIPLMKKVVAETLDDTVEIAKLLKADTEKQTCQNIWEFCFNHLQYQKDEPGIEQVRRPARVWKDRKNKGVDCDCMSVFIGSILTNLGIPFSFRLTKYTSPEFEHVYPIAHTKNGVVIIDAVVHKFNREVPYSSKKDIKMDLQYLNGLENDLGFTAEELENIEEFEELDELLENEYPMDAQELLGDQDLDGLEGRAERRARRKARKAKRKSRRANRKAKRKVRKAKRKEKIQNFKKLSLKEKLKKGLHVVNRINPGAALLRLGILASMKLNLMKVASKLRFAYWTNAEAKRQNMDIGKFNQLKRIREKLEKIFFGAGGKTHNLKKAILEGRGNRDRRVVLNGLGAVISNVTDEDDLITIVGEDIFDDEFSDVDFGVDGLGSAAATGTAIAAATGVIGAIAKLIKQLGSMFNKGSKQAEQEVLQENTENQEEKTRRFSVKNLISNFQQNASQLTPPTTVEKRSSPTAPEPIPDDFSAEAFIPQKSMVTTTDDALPAEDNPEEEKGVIAWVKKHPYLTAGIATTVIGGTALTVWLVRKNKKKKSLSGVSTKRKKKKTTKKSSSKKTRAKTTRKKTTRPKKAKVKKVELL